ncbi:exopolysaccharide biosynthesis protein EpsL [Massilia sp. YIM B02769]|uniref:XrtB/PEP-CTERM-associated polysaccharide biosynthesis outer membrane protein EpsL n=1 Tax=Massilia sp. YIM B02769 TaxID=3050129 RepID=UPI0025B6C8D2|nr:XrtB/PEP-CTERM-associated polysaccharide biosynthesis outer membrane protein EpsL [Massilia sp. YIM B02769]MDN4059341.1 exopolysaccharide biosynthesis protein EpsL [Massilia sp. YIM B02769]
MSRFCLRPPMLLAGALACGPALAVPGTGLDLYGRIGWAYDDNLLRIPGDAPAFDNQRSDSWRTLEAGAVYDRTISRQRLVAHAKLSKVKFDHFRQLDYDGRDVQGTWYWQLGNRFEGELGVVYAQTLAPYTDFRSDQRNLRKQRRGFFEGGWKLHPRWEAHAAVSRDKYDYELAAQAFNDRTEDVVEVEGRYLARSGSAVGLVLRRIEGSYPNRRPFSASLLTDDFTQDELKARVDWKASGATTLQALAGYARRKQPSFGSGRTSGVNGRVTLLHDRSGKLHYRASLWRDFAPIESTVVSYTLNKGASAGLTWDARAKLRVEADLAYEQRDYSPRVTLPVPGGLEDSLRTASLKATWAPRQSISLSAAYFHQARSGSQLLGIGKFKSNGFAINASGQF